MQEIEFIYFFKNSKEIMALLERDNIKVEEVSDYHIYPIADNDTPRLSADRFEYTLSGGLYQVRVFELKDIEKYYNNMDFLKFITKYLILTIKYGINILSGTQETFEALSHFLYYSEV